MNQAPVFSIVIPTLDEEKYLGNLLQDIAGQTFTDFEVLVVDGQSSDATLKIAQSFAATCTLRVFTSNQANVSHQRNLGGQAARGNWLLFIDADTRIPSYFLQGIKYQLEKHPQTEIFSTMINSKEYELQYRTLIDFMNLSFEVRSKISPLAIGAFIGLKRQLFSDYEFDESLKMAEDQDFVNRLAKDHVFKFFREPCYVFSLRRHKKENLLSLAKKYVSSDLFMLSKGQLVKDLPEYEMKGGKYYEENWDSDDH